MVHIHLLLEVDATFESLLVGVGGRIQMGITRENITPICQDMLIQKQASQYRSQNIFDLKSWPLFSSSLHFYKTMKRIINRQTCCVLVIQLHTMVGHIGVSEQIPPA